MRNLYNCKSTFPGMGGSEADQLRELESEDARHMKLLAEAALDSSLLNCVIKSRGFSRSFVSDLSAVCSIPAAKVCAPPAA